MITMPQSYSTPMSYSYNDYARSLVDKKVLTYGWTAHFGTSTSVQNSKLYLSAGNVIVRWVRELEGLKITSYVFPGMSGGPVFIDGEILGIVVRENTQGAKENYCLVINKWLYNAFQENANK